MERAGVAGNDESDAAGERDQLLERGRSGRRASAVCLHNDVGKGLFAGAGVDQDAQPRSIRPCAPRHSVRRASAWRPSPRRD